MVDVYFLSYTLSDSVGNEYPPAVGRNMNQSYKYKHYDTFAGVYESTNLKKDINHVHFQCV